MIDPHAAKGCRCICGRPAKYVCRGQNGVLLSASCAEHVGDSVKVHAVNFAVTVYEAFGSE